MAIRSSTTYFGGAAKREYSSKNVSVVLYHEGGKFTAYTDGRRIFQFDENESNAEVKAIRMARDFAEREARRKG